MAEEIKYQCAVCKRVLTMGWSEEEAQAEYLENFGKEIVENDEGVRICDDCFKIVDPKKHPEITAKAKAEFYKNRN